MTKEDLPAAMRLKNDAGWNQSEDDWGWLIHSNQSGCIVACDDSKIIGTASTITYEGRTAWIGMVIVEPGYRRRGIGTALLKRALELLDGLGVKSVKLDATPAGKPLYERLGFIREFEIERWQLIRRSLARASPVRAIDRLMCGSSNPWLEGLLSLDRVVFGADRSDLIRAILEAAPELASVCAVPPTISGYALGRRGWIADQLGPWVAVDEPAATDVLDMFLRNSTRLHVFVDCVKQSPWAIPLAMSRGFTFCRPLTRMYRGESHPGKLQLMGAVLGPEFG